MAEKSPPFQMSSDPGHVTVTLQPEVKSVNWGELEAFGSTVLGEIEKHSRPSCLVDLTELDYMGSAQVAFLLRLWKGIQAKNGQMVLACHQPVVLEVITLAGLNQVWDIVPSVEVGYRKLGRRRSSSGARNAGSGTRSRRLLLAGIVAMLLAIVLLVLTQSLTDRGPNPAENDRPTSAEQEQASE